MNFKNIDKNAQKEITALFASVFTESEGESEGQLIRNLVLKLSSNIDNQEIICLSAYQDELIIGSIFLTRLKVNKPIDIYMLAPVAVSTEYQGKGIGQALINYGLKELKNRD
ncbi:MAG: GNAT family N-acetyltransferase, partial [Proteobacteria bacterium]|nr:GNAT family N-acetyltransferase [Pseudomonadota bacterium]